MRTRLAEPDEVRRFYSGHHDAIGAKRFDSPYPIRRYVHRSNLDAIARYVPAEGTTIDVGAGEGGLAMILAGTRPNGHLVAVDISRPNLLTGRGRAVDAGLAGRVSFVAADAERLPFRDGGVPTVISSHCLEHLPDFDRGGRELVRVARDRILVGLPTCLNPAAWLLLGGRPYWVLTKRAPLAFVVGMARTVLNLGGDGVDEGYGGRRDVPHVWFYPWAVRRRLRAVGIAIDRYESISLTLPFLGNWRPFLALQRRIDRLRAVPGLRALGFSCVVVGHPAAGPS